MLVSSGMNEIAIPWVGDGSSCPNGVVPGREWEAGKGVGGYAEGKAGYSLQSSDWTAVDSVTATAGGDVPGGIRLGVDALAIPDRLTDKRLCLGSSSYAGGGGYQI